VRAEAVLVQLVTHSAIDECVSEDGWFPAAFVEVTCFLLPAWYYFFFWSLPSNPNDAFDEGDISCISYSVSVQPSQSTGPPPHLMLQNQQHTRQMWSQCSGPTERLRAPTPPGV